MRHHRARGIGPARLARGGVLLGRGLRVRLPRAGRARHRRGWSRCGCAVGYAAWRPRAARAPGRRPGPGGPRRAGAGDADRPQHQPAAARPRLVADDRCGARGGAGTAAAAAPRPGHHGRLPGAHRPARRGAGRSAAGHPARPARPGRRWRRGHGDTAPGLGAPADPPAHRRCRPAWRAASTAGSTGCRTAAITFDTLREYVIGDELRHVHWRTSAQGRRADGPRAPRHQPAPASWCCSTTAPRRTRTRRDGVAEPFEAACEAAASIVAAAVREDLPVALHLVSGARGSGGRRADTARPYLDLLAEADAAPGDAEPDGTALRTRCGTGRLGDTLVYLTGAGGRADLGAGRARCAGRTRRSWSACSATGRPTPATGRRRPARARRRGRRPSSPPPGTGCAHGEPAARRCRCPLVLVGLIALAGVVLGRIYPARCSPSWSPARPSASVAVSVAAAAAAGLVGRAGLGARAGRRTRVLAVRLAASRAERARRPARRRSPTRCATASRGCSPR